MPEPNGNAERVFTPTAAARDAILDAFDAAWRRGERPKIGDFLRQPGAVDRRLLLELVHTDMQYRFKVGEPAQAEDYLAAWSLLADDREAALELIEAEFQMRCGADPTLAADDFVRRFPQYAADLSPRLQSAHAKDTPGFESTVVHADQAGLAGDSTFVPAADVQGDPTAPRRETSTPSRYRTLRFHAKGGIGEVHVAEDSELRREVALKRIQERHGDDAGLRRRFLLEAEITARLQHPGIVPVYGLVEDADGQPSYAMRFIEGQSLKDAIDRFHGGREQGTGDREQGDAGSGEEGKRGRGEEGTNPQSFASLEFRKLLGRFIDACNAIEYAHSRGVIHRDIKPANIMLGEYGETLVVDWGLAKVLGRAGGVSPLLNQPDVASSSVVPPHVGPPTSGSEPIADSPAHTHQGMLVGTAQYMSPEQAECRHDLVNRTSDVYCLGATLYTLLTGRAPVVGADLWAVVADVQEGHFPPPRQINRGVPRPLEAICLKAMSLKPAERYASARRLAGDIERWLADEPVTAYGERRTERAGRWLRRHRAWAQAATAALVLVTSVSLVAVALINSAKEATANALTAETKAKDDAKQAAAAERVATENAMRRLTQVEKGNEILGSIFRDLDPLAEEKDGETLRELLGERLDKATNELEGEAIGDAMAVAKLQVTLGESQLALGYPEKAIELFIRAQATFTAKEGREHRDTLAIMNCLAQAYLDCGALDVAIPRFEETLKMRMASLGPEDPDTLGSMNNLATAYQESGKLDLALPLLEATLELQKAKLGPEHRDTLFMMNNLANAYHTGGKLDLAIPLYEETLKRTKAKLGVEHTVTLSHMNNLAAAYQDAGKFELALAVFEETLKLTKAKLGTKHPRTLTIMNNLGNAYVAGGMLDLAIPLLEETLKLQSSKRGPEHPHTLASMNNLANAYLAAGRLDMAIPLLEETLDLHEAKLGTGHPGTLYVMHCLASAYHDAGKLDLAIPLLKETLDLRRANLGPEHTDTLSSINALGMAYKDAGKLDMALPLYEEALKLRKAKLGPQHPATLTSMNNLAGAYQANGQLNLALPLLEETLDLSRAKLGTEHPQTLTTMNNLASAYRAAGTLGTALSLFEETFKLKQAKLGLEHPDTLLTGANLGVVYRDAGRLDEAIPLLERAYQHSHRYPSLRSFLGTLLDTYIKAGKSEAARTLLNNELARAREGLAANSPQLAGALAQFASTLGELKAFADAEILLRECLTIRETQQPDAWTTFNTRSMLGGALLGQEKYTDAEPLLVAGYEGMDERRDQIPEQGKVRLTQALERLVDLYDALDQKDKADDWRRKLEEAKPTAPTPE